MRSAAGLLRVETSAGVFEIACGHPHKVGERISLLVRPQGIQLAEAGNLQGVVADAIFYQERFKITLEDGLYFYLSQVLRIGEEISLTISPGAVQCLS